MTVEHLAPLRGAIKFIFVMLLALGIGFLLRTYAVEPFIVPTESMSPTIEVGDSILTEKVTTELGNTPKQGDIVVFRNPENTAGEEYLVKRVIATAGQTVTIEDGKVSVDGKALSEPYAVGTTEPLDRFDDLAATVTYPYTVPDNAVWVMGDNRENSKDSRWFGAIDTSNIVGVAKLCYFPLNRISILH